MRAIGLSIATCALAAVAWGAAWSSSPARADVVAPGPSVVSAIAAAVPRPKASAAAPPGSVPTPAPAPQGTLDAFDAETFSDESSKSPTPEEWKAAKELAPTRRGGRADHCHVWRVREWIRVSCPDLVTASLAMLGGTPTGMSFWIDPPKEGSGGKLPAGGEVMFPVRKGDRRVVQFLSFGPGYEGPFTQLPALVVQELWLENASAPTLILY